ncbi:MAG: hypothetical protein ACLFWF_11630 [Alphaproteobacteria bacterium]
MDTFWITFRLNDDAIYEERYNQLHMAVCDMADGKYWPEPTSFFAFLSDAPVSAIVQRLKAAINTKTDVVVLGSFQKKTCRIIGNLQDRDLLEMVDFAKKED